MCEVGKAYFSETLSTSFNDPRLTLLYDDAARYLREEGSKQNYDVIICDSSDPVGPAEALFKPEFFLSMKNALGPDGIICTQGECIWLHLDLIAGVFQQCKNIFPSVKYGYTTIPTYPSGQIGFIIASNNGTVDPSIPTLSNRVTRPGITPSPSKSGLSSDPSNNDCIPIHIPKNGLSARTYARNASSQPLLRKLYIQITLIKL